MVHHLHQRKLNQMHVYAAHCWRQANFQPAAAGVLFAKKYPAHSSGNRSAPDKFCKLWGERAVAGKELKDKWGGGHYKVKKAAAIKASRIYKKGDVITMLPFTSVRRALRQSKKLRQVMEELHCSARTLDAAMHRCDPNLTSETLILKPVLSIKQQHDRLANARWNLDKLHNNPDYLMKTLMCDSHTEELPPPGRHLTGAGDKRRPRQTIISHPLLSSHGKPLKKAVVYAGVNQLVGGVGPVFCTGTTDQPNRFQVSPLTPLPYPPAACCCTAGSVAVVVSTVNLAGRP
jgi:hypothetical protein